MNMTVMTLLSQNWSMLTSEDLSTGVKETAKIFKSFIHESQEERSRNIAYG